MKNVLITRVGNLIRLDPPCNLMLDQHLRFTKRLQTGGNPGSDCKYQEVVLYTMDDGKLVAPAGLTTRICTLLREYGLSVSFRDLRPCILPKPDLSRVAHLRPEQVDMLSAIIAHDHGIIQGPTASGKSFLIRQLCLVWPISNIIITSPFKRVVQRTREELLEVLPPNSVGLVGAGGRYNARVTVSTTQSLQHCDLDKVQLFIFDEVHKAAAPKTMELISSITTARMFGFSASPKGRSDRADMETESMFGPIIYEASYEEVQKSGSIVPIEVYMVSCADISPMKENTPTTTNRHCVWRNRLRNQKVANAARWALNQFGDDIQILITVSTVEHLVHLSKFLPDFTVCYANMSGADKDKYVRWKLIDPNAHPISARERAGIESAFEEGRLRRCIATATSGGVWSTGVDFPHLNVLIRADAQAAPILNTQIPGRVSRTAEGKNCGILIDFDDCFNDLLKRRAKRRLSSYRGKKWEIKDLFSRHVSAAPA